ncbi:MAG: helix-turn-helix domain-containing protein [Acholeplasmataceae bacterium]|nr:helix-turn-helix domain-containing protein [Acholeplasmataceae bacterium]
MDAQKIGLFLFKLRKEKHLTQKEIAEICNVSTQAVSKWERGESIPDVELLERLSIYYNLTINEILNGEEKQSSIDATRKSNIIILSTSILVFLSFFFTYAGVLLNNSPINQDLIILYKGYELIFDRINIWEARLTQFVFIILIINLVLSIFIVSNVIKKEKYVSIYIIISSILLILVSLLSIAHESFYVFPQIFILLHALITLFMSIKVNDKDHFLSKLKAYKTLKKNNEVPSSLLLSEEVLNSKGLKIIKILILLISSIFILFSIFAMIGYIIELTTPSASPEIDFIFLISIFLFITGITSLNSYKYIGSIYTSEMLVFDAIISLILSVLVIFVVTFSLHFVLILNIILASYFIYSAKKYSKTKHNLN